MHVITVNQGICFKVHIHISNGIHQLVLVLATKHGTMWQILFCTQRPVPGERLQIGIGTRMRLFSQKRKLEKQQNKRNRNKNFQRTYFENS